jgi:hypothetical protein
MSASEVATKVVVENELLQAFFAEATARQAGGR